MRKLLLLLIVPAFLFVSCQKDEKDNNDQQINQVDKMNDLIIPDNFNFTTSTNTSISLRALDNTGNPVPGVRFNIYNAHPDSSGKLLAAGITGAQGLLATNHPLPDYLEYVFVETPHIGFPNLKQLPVKAGIVNHTFGGVSSKHIKSQSSKKSLLNIRNTGNAVIQPLGSYNYFGVPNYLEPQDEVIDAAFLNDINTTFPENQPVPTYHPEFLAQGVETNIVLNQLAEVWITFVHEGAGYKNVLGFYKYDSNNPPTSTSDIDTIFIAFPNTSFSGSGGDLNTGNKVKLGIFQPGTTIGFALFANGYQNATITTGSHIVYSNPVLNTVSDPANRQHTVLLNDPSRKKLLIGFEDMKRDGGADNDFNDAIFLVESNPITSIETNDVPLADYNDTDSDNDGVDDNFDDFPNDPSKTFANHYPAENTFGTLAYEDLWPGKGDYDMNDVVIDYNFTLLTDNNNDVSSIEGVIIPRATGASFHNGFGFEMDIAPSQISSITGININEDIVSLNANNTETGQNKAVVIVFEDAYDYLTYPGGSGTGVNTSSGQPFVTPDTIRFNIDLQSPLAPSVIGIPPFNAFIFADGDRAKEIHLPDMEPTNLANLGLFGTKSDDSNPSIGRYYKTVENLPWGMHIIDSFDYPEEKKPIIQAYNFFDDWAQSAGMAYPDWFRNKSGYRNNSKIFQQ